MALFKWEGRKAGEGGSATLGQGFSMVSIKLTDWLSYGFWEASSLESKSGEQKFNWLYHDAWPLSPWTWVSLSMI